MSVKIYAIVVNESLAGVRLDKAVATLWPDLSRKLAQRIIAAGGCYLDGRRCHVPATLLVPGQRLRVCVDLDQPFISFHLNKEMVLLEDQWLLVVDKPSGVPVNLSATAQEGSVQRGVEEYFTAKGIAHHPAVLHRLDLATSGVVLFAKDKQTEKQLYAAFRQHTIKKEYLALVSPPPLKPEGVIKTRIARRTDRRNQYAVRRERGQEALTAYRQLRCTPDSRTALLAVIPETGRPHQIRVHLAWLAAPIVGDTLYGGIPHPNVFGLHAHKLRLAHPATGESLEITSSLPGSWIKAFSWLNEF